MLATKLPEIRELVKGFDDAALESDPNAFPDVQRHKLPRKGQRAVPGHLREAATVQALLQPLRQLRKPRELAKELTRRPR